MIIEENDFRLTSINEHSLLFDLELLYTIKPRNGTPRKEFKNVAYGLPLDSALFKVVQYRISNKFETTTLKSYIEEFKKQIKDLEDLYGKEKYLDRHSQ